MSILENKQGTKKTLPNLDPSTINIESIKIKAEAGDVQAQYELACHFKNTSIDQYVLYLQLAADNGHVKAQYELGCEYDDSLSGACPRSYKMAAHYFKLAADQGFAPAQTMLGYFYDYGLGVDQSYEKAIYYYLEAGSNSFHSIAYALLAQCYELGHGVPQSDEKAKYYFGLSLIQPMTPVLCSLDKFRTTYGPCIHNAGHIAKFQNYGYFKEICFRDTLRTFLSDKANAIVLKKQIAIFSVIESYKKGKVVPKDDLKALEYTELLSQLFPKQHYDLATHYKSPPIDFTSKVLFQHFLEKAANNKSIEAILEIGKSYDYGDNGYPCDAKKAFEYYLKAAELGNAEAQFAVGTLYYFGKGTTESDEKALEYLKTAAEQEYIYALGLLGHWYGDGILTYASKEIGGDFYKRCMNCYFDPKMIYERIKTSKRKKFSTARYARCLLEAFGCYLAQAESGNANSQCKVADLYRQGKIYKFCEFNIWKAKMYYSLAAEQGHPKAQRWMGLILEYEGNHAEAYQYFAKAADQGDTCSFAALALCYHEGKGIEKCPEEAAYFFELYEKRKWDQTELKETSFNWGQVELLVYHKVNAVFGNYNVFIKNPHVEFNNAIEKKIDVSREETTIKDLTEKLEMQRALIKNINRPSGLSGSSMYDEIYNEILEMEETIINATSLQKELKRYGIPLVFDDVNVDDKSFEISEIQLDNNSNLNLRVAQIDERVEALYNPIQNSIHPLPNSRLFEQFFKNQNMKIYLNDDSGNDYFIDRIRNNNISEETCKLCCNFYYLKRKTFMTIAGVQNIRVLPTKISKIIAVNISNLESGTCPKINKDRLKFITFLWLTREG